MARLVGLALLAVLVIAVLTLPARLLVMTLDLPAELTQAQGSVWAGSARWRQAGQQPMAVKWSWRPALRWDWQVVEGATDLYGQWRPGRALNLPLVRGRLALERLDLSHWLVVARPVGVLELDIEQVERKSDHPPHALGRVVWRQAALRGAIQEPLGEIELRLVPGPEILLIEVESLTDAPILVRGRIEVGPERYEVDLWLRPARDRPDLQRALGDVGELQPDGQVRLRVRGRSGL